MSKARIVKEFVRNEVLCQHPRKKKKDSWAPERRLRAISIGRDLLMYVSDDRSIIGTAEHTCVCLNDGRLSFCLVGGRESPREMRLVELHPSPSRKGGPERRGVQHATWRRVAGFSSEESIFDHSMVLIMIPIV